MATDVAEISVELPCHGCGYDLRVHPADGMCPECGASVAEARRWAAIPRRPVRRESDPQWRRRMLAGVWVIAMLPVVEAARVFGWGSSVTVPRIFEYRGAVWTLNETLLFGSGVYRSLIFCIGLVLLFSKERGRQRGRMDWTRRWGTLSCYVVLLLSIAQVLFMVSLVSVGIAAIFISRPMKYQPHGTKLLAAVSSGYLRYGPHPSNASGIVLVGFSSAAILLACLPLFDALRISGPKWLVKLFPCSAGTVSADSSCGGGAVLL